MTSREGNLWPRRRVLSTLALSAAAVGLGVSGPARAQSADVVAAAEKEGEVWLYTSLDSSDLDPIISSFNQKYPGIHVEVYSAPGSRSLERIQTELASGQLQADIIHLGPEAALELYKKGEIAEYDSPIYAKLPAWAKVDNYLAGLRATVIGFMYNTDLIPADQVPKSFPEMAALSEKPEFKKRIAVIDPVAYGPTAARQALQLQQVYGDKVWDYYKQLSPNVVFGQTGNEVGARVASGEFAAVIGEYYYTYWDLKQSGAPVGWVSPTEGVSVNPVTVGVLTKANHPNAARVLFEFLFTPEVGKMLVESGGFNPIVPGVDLPAGYTDIADFPLTKTDDGDFFISIDMTSKLTEQSKAAVEKLKAAYGVQ